MLQIYRGLLGEPRIYIKWRAVSAYAAADAALLWMATYNNVNQHQNPFFINFLLIMIT